MSTRTIEEYALPASSMGNTRTLSVIRYGDRRAPIKAYIQAGLHANESPGYLVMHHLIDRIAREDEAGSILGEIVLVPVANPVGLGQWQAEFLQGRFDYRDNLNFNRAHLDMTQQIADRIKTRLQRSPEQNVILIRETAAEVLDSIVPTGETEYLKHLLLKLSYNADIVLDLHCDDQAVVHVYLGTPLWPAAADLSAQMGAAVTLLAEDSGVTPFDEACSRIWWRLAKRFPEYPIPPACLAATIELRGMADTTHQQAAADAENIFVFLQRRGFFKGQAPDIPRLPGDATPLTAVEHIKAPAPGVVVFFKEAGERVEKGELIAEVVNPVATAPEERLHPVTCSSTGILFARIADRHAHPGRILAKIAGKTPLKHKGENLLTA